MLFINFAKHSIFFFLFLVLQSFEGFSQCILSIPLFVQKISRKYLKPKSLSNIKLLNTVLLLELFIDYHSNDIPVKVLKIQ